MAARESRPLHHRQLHPLEGHGGLRGSRVALQFHRHWGELGIHPRNDGEGTVEGYIILTFIIHFILSINIILLCISWPRNTVFR